MSWNFKLTSKDKDKLKEAVREQAHCPPAFKEAVCETIDQLKLTDVHQQGVEFAAGVNSDGHVDEMHGHGTFTVYRTRII